MSTRRLLLTAAPSLAASLVVPRAGEAATVATPGPHADFLFVQTAKGMLFDKATSTLTLDGISSVTTFFSDRPQRIAGWCST